MLPMFGYVVGLLKYHLKVEALSVNTWSKYQPDLCAQKNL